MKIEGRNPVLELLRTEQKINKLYVQDSAIKELDEHISLAKQKGVSVKVLPKQAIEKESASGHHQGVIAFTEDFEYSTLEDILAYAKQKNEPPFIVLVDEVADPHNLGSIIRTCECAGVHGIVIQKNRSVQVNETVIKVSTGAAYQMKIARVTNINDAVRELKENDVFVYALEADGQAMYQTDLTGAVALVVGSEGFGVGALTKKISDAVISLPMKGKINSLNASVAAGIAVYEVLKQRMGK